MTGIADIPAAPFDSENAGLSLTAERIADKLGGREIVCEYVMQGGNNFWRAIVYPTREAIARRLQRDECSLTEGQIFALENRPIGIGKGATKTEAVRNITPVSWRH